MDRRRFRQCIFHLMAQILEYPQSDLAEVVCECEALLSLEYSEAASCLREFQDFVAGTPLGRQQEVYTLTFDLDAVCHPYVGHHLFGESYKRSAFMLGLKERYQNVGLETGSEVADHLALLVRFLSLCDDAGEAEVIIHDALVPALQKMLKQKDEIETESDKLAAGKVEKPRVYQAVLEALSRMLQALPANAHVPSPREAASALAQK
ncbi:MAG: molecular chaperone TorD family protein [Chloroflexota bacterium]